MANHQWENIYSYQWAASGDTYESAHAIYLCKICGITFTHWYYQVKNIYTALEQAGISKECDENSSKPKGE